jgi:hypothetical protein
MAWVWNSKHATFILSRSVYQANGKRLGNYVYVLWVKLKLFHYTPCRCLGGEQYTAYSFSTSSVDGSEWSASRPGRALTQGNGPPVPIVQEVEWAPELVWTQRLEEKSFRPCRGSNLDRPVVQPVARHYNDWATRLTHTWVIGHTIIIVSHDTRSILLNADMNMD